MQRCELNENNLSTSPSYTQYHNYMMYHIAEKFGTILNVEVMKQLNQLTASVYTIDPAEERASA